MDGDLWPAYILHSRPFQEDKLLLQLLLPEQGRITAVIRRRSGKQHRALQPFQLFALALVGRSSLLTVKQIEEQAPAMIFSGKVLFSAMYINELICRLWPKDLASDGLFTHYQTALTALAQTQLQPELLEPSLRQFEFALLAELGLLPDWYFDAMQQPIQPEKFYQYQPDQGFIIAKPDPCIPVQCISPDTRYWRGEALLAIAQAEWQRQGVLAAAKQLSRQLLAPLLGGKPLASRALFNGVTKVKPTTASS